MGLRRNELKNVADLILELRVIVAVRSENQFLQYMQILVPPTFG